jgi:hypothetical protein
LDKQTLVDDGIIAEHQVLTYTDTRVVEQNVDSTLLLI